MNYLFLIPPAFRNVFFGLIVLVLLAGVPAAWANLPGGGTGTGGSVTLVDNGNGTVTMANGIVSIVFTKTGAQINNIYSHISQINFTSRS